MFTKTTDATQHQDQKPAVQEPAKTPSQCVFTAWVPATMYWGNFTCPKTQVKGCFYYSPMTGGSSNVVDNDASKGSLITFNREKSTGYTKDPNWKPFVLWEGANADLSQHDPRGAYLNINDDYNGPKLLTIAGFTAECKKRNIPFTAPTLAEGRNLRGKLAEFPTPPSS